MMKKKNIIDNLDFIESIKPEEFASLSIVDTDVSDNGSNVDEGEYLSDEEITNNYAFITKPKKTVNNQYKKQFKFEKKKIELKEEKYLSD